MAAQQHLDADAPSGSVRVHASLPEAPRRSRLAAALSFLFHALLIYIAIRLTAVVTLPTHSPIGDAIKMVLGGGGGGGHSGAPFQRTVVPPPPPPPVPPVVPPPVPAVVPPPPVQPTPPPSPSAAPAAPTAVVGTGGGTGTGTGGGNGSGTGTGNGSGEGAGSGSGKGGGNGERDGSCPTARQFPLPPLDKTPKSLRGKQLDIIFEVSAEGRVVSYSVNPPIDDRKFAKMFDEVTRDYRFTTCKDANGKSLAGRAAVSITLN